MVSSRTTSVNLFPEIWLLQTQEKRPFSRILVTLSILSRCLGARISRRDGSICFNCRKACNMSDSSPSWVEPATKTVFSSRRPRDFLMVVFSSSDTCRAGLSNLRFPVTTIRSRGAPISTIRSASLSDCMAKAATP